MERAQFETLVENCRLAGNRIGTEDAIALANLDPPEIVLPNENLVSDEIATETMKMLCIDSMWFFLYALFVYYFYNTLKLYDLNLLKDLFFNYGLGEQIYLALLTALVILFEVLALTSIFYSCDQGVGKWAKVVIPSIVEMFLQIGCYMLVREQCLQFAIGQMTWVVILFGFMMYATLFTATHVKNLTMFDPLVNVIRKSILTIMIVVLINKFLLLICIMCFAVFNAYNRYHVYRYAIILDDRSLSPDLRFETGIELCLRLIMHRNKDVGITAMKGTNLVELPHWIESSDKYIRTYTLFKNEDIIYGNPKYMTTWDWGNYIIVKGFKDYLKTIDYLRSISYVCLLCILSHGVINHELHSDSLIIAQLLTVTTLSIAISHRKFKFCQEYTFLIVVFSILVYYGLTWIVLAKICNLKYLNYYLL